MSTEIKDTDWDLESAGYEAIEAGTYIGRVAAMVSLGNAPDTFKGKEEFKRRIGFAVDLYTYDEDEDEVGQEVVGRVYEDLMAIQSKRSSLTAWCAAGKAEGLSELPGALMMFEIIKSEKDRNYIKGKPTKALAMIAKRVPEPEVDPIAIPSLDHMTEDALRALNPFIQVQQKMLRATNFEGSQAEVVLKGIREEDPEFANYELKESDDKGSESGSQAKKDKSAAEERRRKMEEEDAKQGDDDEELS